MNVYISSWSKRKHNELKSTSSPGAQSLFSMTETNTDWNAGKKEKGQGDHSLSHARTVSCFENNLRHLDRGRTDGLVQNVSLDKNVDKAVFESDGEMEAGD